MTKPFVLSVKALVLDEDGRCLVLKRSASSRLDAGLWDLVGGKFDGAETLQEVIEREAVEECGLAIRVLGLAGSEHVERDAWHIVYVFLLAEVAGGTFELGSEHDEARWVGVAELDGLALCPGFGPVMEGVLG